MKKFILAAATVASLGSANAADYTYSIERVPNLGTFIHLCDGDAPTCTRSSAVASSRTSSLAAAVYSFRTSREISPQQTLVQTPAEVAPGVTPVVYEVTTTSRTIQNYVPMYHYVVREEGTLVSDGTRTDRCVVERGSYATRDEFRARFNRDPRSIGHDGLMALELSEYGTWGAISYNDRRADPGRIHATLVDGQTCTPGFDDATYSFDVTQSPSAANPEGGFYLSGDSIRGSGTLNRDGIGIATCTLIANQAGTYKIYPDVRNGTDCSFFSEEEKGDFPITITFSE